MIERVLRKILRSVVASEPITFESLHLNLKSVSINDIRSAVIASSKPDETIVIIGAHDLVSFDSVSSYLRQTSCSVFCFEPRLSSCQALARNVEDLSISNLTIIPKAIHGSLPECLLYEVNPNYYSLYPDWAAGIASFSKEHLQKSANEEHVIATCVACSSPLSWHQEYGIGPISYLQIDTEGYDYEILKLIDFNFCKPVAIFMEYANLSQADRIRCHSFLACKGYDTIINGEDVLAFNLGELLLHSCKHAAAY